MLIDLPQYVPRPCGGAIRSELEKMADASCGCRRQNRIYSRLWQVRPLSLAPCWIVWHGFIHVLPVSFTLGQDAANRDDDTIIIIRF